MATVTRRRLVGVSLKMYFNVASTSGYLEAIAAILGPLATMDSSVEIFVLPDFVTLLLAQSILAHTSIRYGAQDAFWETRGAFTGEVSPDTLSQAGCWCVALGHAERRRIFHETDADVARKASSAVSEGLVPLVCVGERSRGAVSIAVEECRPQVEAVLGAVPDDTELIFAYEPVWAIGQPEPASAEHVVAVATEIRAMCQSKSGLVRILYGGSAGPGTFEKLKDAVDGLFLGRFAHDVRAFREVVLEMEQS